MSRSSSTKGLRNIEGDEIDSSIVIGDKATDSSAHKTTGISKYAHDDNCGKGRFGSVVLGGAIVLASAHGSHLKKTVEHLSENVKNYQHDHPTDAKDVFGSAFNNAMMEANKRELEKAKKKAEKWAKLGDNIAMFSGSIEQMARTGAQKNSFSCFMQSDTNGAKHVVSDGNSVDSKTDTDFEYC